MMRATAYLLLALACLLCFIPALFAGLEVALVLGHILWAPVPAACMLLSACYCMRQAEQYL
jgi:hypothetical protein